MYLTVKDLQQRLGIGRDMAYRFMHQKGFPSIKINRRYVVEDLKLREYLDKHTGKQIIIDK